LFIALRSTGWCLTLRRSVDGSLAAAD